jgi:hypothetical protein
MKALPRLLGLKMILLWVICAVAGFALGVPVGEGVFAIGAKGGLGFVSIYAGSFLIVGTLVAWYFMPIENRYLWSRSRVASEDPGSVEAKILLLRVAPISLFFVVGMLVGISHRNAPWVLNLVVGAVT